MPCASGIAWECRFGMLRAMQTRGPETATLGLSTDENASEQPLPGSAKGRIAVSVSHELRSPLGAIEASVYLIAQRLERLGVADESIRRHLDRVRMQVRLCSSIISRQLELAGEAEHQPSRAESVVQDSIEDASSSRESAS